MSKITPEDIRNEAHDSCLVRTGPSNGVIFNVSKHDDIQKDVDAAIAVNEQLPEIFDTVSCNPKFVYGSFRLGGSFVNSKGEEVLVSVVVDRWKATLELRPNEMAEFLKLFAKKNPKK